MDNTRPVYGIGVMSEIMRVHPETLRVWERHRLINPARRNGQRLYSESDLKRLEFIKELIQKGLNLAAVKHYLGLYPCWFRGACPACMHQSERVACAKRCWKEQGAYCCVSFDEPDPCSTCQFRDLECPVEQPVANRAGVGVKEEDSNSKHS